MCMKIQPNRKMPVMAMTAFLPMAEVQKSAIQEALGCDRTDGVAGAATLMGRMISAPPRAHASPSAPSDVRRRIDAVGLAVGCWPLADFRRHERLLFAARGEEFSQLRAAHLHHDDLVVVRHDVAQVLERDHA